MKDKVALITPSFNRGYIIGETAESIFAQTHENWEWIIVDDGSTDDSWELIQSFAARDPRVKALQRHRDPKGACTCRNIAVENTDADWLIFLDTDDLLHQNCLKQRLTAAQSSGAMEVLYFPILIFEESTDECHLWDDPDHPTEWLEGVLTMRPPVQGSGTFWPRALWASHGGWREDLRVWQDIELHARAHWEGVQFKPAPNVFPDFYLRVSPDSLSRVGFHSWEKLESRLVVIKECWNHFEAKGGTESERTALADNDTQRHEKWSKPRLVRHYECTVVGTSIHADQQGICTGQTHPKVEAMETRPDSTGTSANPTTMVANLALHWS